MDLPATPRPDTRFSISGWEFMLLGVASALLLWQQWPSGKIVGFEDGGALFYPHLVFFARSLQSGHIPLWNPYEWSGQSFCGHQASPIYYPLHYLCAIMPVDRFLLFDAIGHVWFGGVGMLVLLRHWGFERRGSLALSVGFVWSALFYREFERSSMIEINAWMPWFLWCCDRCRDHARAGLAAALVLALQLAAGFFQSVQLEAVITAVLLVGIWRDRTRASRLLWVPLLGLGLSAVMLGPVVTSLRESTRLLALPAYFHVYSLHVSDLLQVFFPKFSGVPLGSSDPPPYGIPLGWTLLAFCSWSTRSPLWKSSLALVFVGLVLALSDGSAWEPLLNWVVPTYASCRYRARYIELALLGIMLLAGYGYQHLSRSHARIANLLVGLALLESAALAFHANPAVVPDRAVPVSAFAGMDKDLRYIPCPLLYRHYWNWGCVSGVSCVCGYGSVSLRICEDVLSFAEFGQRVLPSNIQDCLNDNGIRPKLNPSRSILRIFSPQGALWSARSGGPCLFWKFDHPSPRLALCGRVSVLPQADARLARMAAADFDPANEVVVEHPLSDPIGPCAPGSRVWETRFTPDELECEVVLAGKSPAVLRLSEIEQPGWNTEVDGLPSETLRVDHCLRGVVVYPGHHRVRQFYRPLPLIYGGVVSILTVCLWLAAWFWCFKP